jgi:hypothetical protein
MLWARERATAGCSTLLERLGAELWWLETLERRGWTMDQRVRRQPRHNRSVIRLPGIKGGRCLAIVNLHFLIGLYVLAVLEEPSFFTYTYSACKHQATVLASRLVHQQR